jgi:hypothetical protein
LEDVPIALRGRRIESENISSENGTWFVKKLSRSSTQGNLADDDRQKPKLGAER